MVFVKIVKNKAFFKRYQTKLRRRRENKTDYRARIRLITQDKNKYATPRYRFVVRFTNRDVICQIFSSSMTDDKCICAAYSHELQRYGVKVGLANYAAAYATGLLLARRLDRKYRLYFEGNKNVTGDDFWQEDDGSGMAPFKALLDVGLIRTTAGARVFGAMKGACDGGLDIPHNKKKGVPRMYPGSTKEGEGGKKWNYEPDVHRKYIFGGHVAEYMKYLLDNDKEKYKKHFSQYIKLGVGPDDIEPMYTKAHALIRREPLKARDALECGYFAPKRAKAKDAKFKYPVVHFNKTALPLASRQDRIRQKLVAMGKTSAPLLEKYEVKN